ncbi:MAG TPA: cell division protein FtsL [Bacillota bacterium]|nr:cell division protein FtsL [Bacillota bacterium]
MILARGDNNTQWDGKRAAMTAGEIFKEPMQSARNKFTLLLVGVILVSGLGVGRIALDNRISVQCAQLENMQNQALVLRKENDKLQQRIRISGQLDRMEKIALQKLKMVKPDLQQMMFVSE